MLKNLNNILLLSILFIVVSCEMTTPEYYYTKGGLKYKYHDIVSEGETPANGDYLRVYMDWKTSGDSVFYSSRGNMNKQTDLIVLKEPEIKGGIEEGFAMLKEGDSVTFYISPEVFFRNYLNEELPRFLDTMKEMKISMRLLKIQTEEEYKEEEQIWLDQMELKEFSLVQDVLKEWESEADSVFDFSGVYLVYDSIRLDSNYVRYKDVVKIHYIAEFADGNEFYNTYKNGTPDEFQLGKPDQTVEGLKIAISAMRYGQKAKALVTSSLGFGEKGSTGKIVPPFTPVIYKIEVLEKDSSEAI